MDVLRRLVSTRRGLSAEQRLIEPSISSEAYYRTQPDSQNPFSDSRSFLNRSMSMNPLKAGEYTRLEGEAPEASPPLTQPGTNSRLQALLGFFRRHMLAFACCLPLASALLEIVMLCSFLGTYMSLAPKPKTGLRPRLSPFYSIWPFVSCIGSSELSTFRAFSFSTTCCSVLGSVISLNLNRNVHPGYWLRRLQLLQSLTASGFLIWLSFASENSSNHLHLLLVSIRLILLFGTKTASWLTWRSMRSAYPSLRLDHASTTSFYWKIGLMTLALPTAMLANVGPYSCREPSWIHTTGSTCYNLIAASAISDWIYSLINISFLMNFMYDLYNDEHYGRARKEHALARDDVHLEAQRAG